MKKLLYCAAALATLLFAGSCQRENLEPAVEGTTVTYTVSVPGVMATKASSYTGVVDSLVYEVHGANGRLYKNNAKFTNGVATLDIEVVKDQNFTILFWAQKKGVAFDTEYLEKVKMPTTFTANVEDYEAFYGVDEFTYTTDISATNNVELTRAVSMLNVATTESSLKVGGVEKSNVAVTATSVTVTGLNKTLNVMTGAATDPYTESSPLACSYVVPATYETVEFGETDYVYVAKNFVGFAGDVEKPYKSLTNVVLNITTSEGEIEHVIQSVPFQRNYKTNIVGNLISANATYEVELNNIWNTLDEVIEVWNGSEINEPKKSATDENIYEIEFPSELAWLAAAVNGTLPVDTKAAGTKAADSFAGKTFVLISDIDLNNCDWTPIGSENTPFKGTFDGQDHIVKNLVVNGGRESDKGLFGVTMDGEIKRLVVENAKVSGRLNVGVVAGTPYTSKYTNIKVKGHIEVNGMAYVGAVGGKNAYADWTGITVNAAEGSYVKANSVENGTAYRTYVGGVVGFNGEGGHKFTNITSNINVEGSTCDVGGLFGIAHYGNQFENCVCTGNVTITTDEAENALEMGGIAGVWHNGGENVVLTECRFDGELSAPNVAEDVDYYYGGLVGCPYSATGSGKLIINGKQYVATAAQLQAAINAAEGETTLYLGYDIVGDVTVVQKAGVKITIEGEDHKFNGSIKVHSNSNYYADAALTIKNVNFETSAASVNVIEALENGSERYSSNLTVENCTFTATGEAVNTSVAVQVKATRGVTVTGCTATDMHSLVQAQSCDTGDVKVINCTVNGKNGVAFKQVKSAKVEGTTITAIEYGIRFDGNIDNYGIVVKNNTVEANQPLIVRKMTGQNNTITLEGTNTLTTEAEYQIVITNGQDDADYVKPTGTYTLTGADGYSVFPSAFPVATWNEFTAALAAGEDWIKLTDDITYSGNYSLKNNIILDLGGKSITMPMFYVFSTSTIKNGTINGKMYARTGCKVTLEDLTFSGTISDDLSTEGHLQVQGSCDVYAKNCTFAATTVNGSQTRSLSIEGSSSGTRKFENCDFKFVSWGTGAGKYKKNVYINTMSGTTTVNFTNCKLNGKAPNILFAGAYALTNFTMSGCDNTSPTLETNRAKDAITDAEWDHISSLIANNKFTRVRLFYAGGSSEYIY